MNKLSVVVSAYNEEKRIAQCLKSCSFADEIIVVDNHSLDRTAEIATKYASKIIAQENNPLAIDLLKNIGFDKATSDWILSLDADETISPNLAIEIKEAIENQEIDGFLIPRQNFIFGKWIEYGGWYPDYQLRLFKKGKGRFVKEHVHESLEIKGKTATLKNHIIHQNYETVEQFVGKTIKNYAQNEADAILAKGYTFSFFHSVSFPLKEFLSRFFARKGYKDGFHGFMLASFMAFYHFIVFALIWEKLGFKKLDEKKLFEEFTKEGKKAKKDIVFWFMTMKIESSKNILLKRFYKIKRKLKKLSL